MSIPLDPIKLPAWLLRAKSHTALAHRAIRITGQLRKKLPAQIRDLHVLEIVPLLNEARDAHIDGKVASLFDELRSTLTGLTTADEIEGSAMRIADALDDAVEAFAETIGLDIRAHGEQGITIAIVEQMYSAARGVVCSFEHGVWLGINDDQLERFIAELVTKGIFEEAGSHTTVRITDRGRAWFEKAVGAIAVAQSEADSSPIMREADSSLRETMGHISFIKDVALRRIAEAAVTEIQRTLGAGAWLATMILCGTLVETLMLAIVEQQPGRFKFATKPNWEEKVSLGDMADELVSLKILKRSVLPLMVTDHRDLVHPNRQRKSRETIRIDSKTAATMVLAAATVAHDLYDACLISEGSAI